jgi:aminoglycoside phosphotransferase (APT) family kinase protein
VLTEGGAISGIIDWGDIAAGDRATDLAAIWMLFDDRSDRRAAMRSCTSVREATWTRAKGWALLFGVLLLATGLVDHPRHAAIGEWTLRRVLEGPVNGAGFPTERAPGTGTRRTRRAARHPA